jgi:hypothetical protein
MPLIYRAMTLDGDKPLLANSARGLGVRVGGGAHDDLPVDAVGHVAPDTGGMSVAPAWRQLPDVRIPPRLRSKGALSARGKNGDACWRLGEGDFVLEVVAEGLRLRPDRADHGTVEPDQVMSLERFLGNLAATRDLWTIDEE